MDSFDLYKLERASFDKAVERFDSFTKLSGTLIFGLAAFAIEKSSDSSDRVRAVGFLVVLITCAYAIIAWQLRGAIRMSRKTVETYEEGLKKGEAPRFPILDDTPPRFGVRRQSWLAAALIGVGAVVAAVLVSGLVIR